MSNVDRSQRCSTTPTARRRARRRARHARRRRESRSFTRSSRQLAERLAPLPVEAVLSWNWPSRRSPPAVDRLGRRGVRRDHRRAGGAVRRRACEARHSRRRGRGRRAASDWRVRQADRIWAVDPRIARALARGGSTRRVPTAERRHADRADETLLLLVGRGSTRRRRPSPRCTSSRGCAPRPVPAVARSTRVRRHGRAAARSRRCSEPRPIGVSAHRRSAAPAVRRRAARSRRDATSADAAGGIPTHNGRSRDTWVRTKLIVDWRCESTALESRTSCRLSSASLTRHSRRNCRHGGNVVDNSGEIPLARLSSG